MTLSTSEETFKYFFKFVLTTATPVLRKWQRPIHSFDSVACNIFDKVAETVKTVANAPDEVGLTDLTAVRT